MKVLTSWLKDFVKFDFSNDKLVEKLNITGTEVEAIEGSIDPNVIVAEILAVNPHANADRLRIATVTDGQTEMNIVCGAPNIAPGQRVPLAKVGAKLPGGIEIKRAVIRGVESEGMLCAPDELGLGGDHSGIMILDRSYELGKSLSEYIEGDSVIEVEITPNRGDCLSHLGVAREIASFSNNSVDISDIELSSSLPKSDLSVSVVQNKSCSQYCALALSGVKVEQSPKWLADRLEKIGLRPINNVVDVTNYILFDLGQPLHAFDADKIAGSKIIVRSAIAGERLPVLDGTTKTLETDDLVIADSDKPIAIAGIIGGTNSEVDTMTTRIVIESAVFDRKSIRRTAKRLGLVTEASYRFERGIDSGSTVYALKKAASMIEQIAGGKIEGDIIRVGTEAKQQSIAVNYGKINQLLGLDLSVAEIDSILASLGFEVQSGECRIPLWRHDISVWQDLAEEVGRIYGYGKISPISPRPESLPAKSPYYYQEHLKDILADNGFSEVINYPFLSAEEIRMAGLAPENLLEVANPMQSENKYLRLALAPGLLRTIAKNPIFDPVLVFEFGKVFTRDAEAKHLAIAASGKGAKDLIGKAIKEICEKTGIEQESFKVSEINRNDLEAYKIRKSAVFLCELSFDQIVVKMDISVESITIKPTERNIVYRPISKFPAVTRDLAFIVDSNVDGEDIVKVIYNQSNMINRAELFDEFVSDRFGQDKKSLAFHVYLEHIDRTLTDKEADEIVKKVTDAVSNEFKAVLRD
ncbi:MAG: phenylalanine--tRNA ligase subunit beta [Patescibacteria group bacterium]|jgi:phenylalanyl-tRNA synthetase beta chain